MTSTLRLAFPSRPEYVVLGRLVLSGLARVQEIGPGPLGDLKLALTEASANSVRHASCGETGTVEIAYELDASHIAIDVADDGPGFDPADVSRDPDTLDEGGLGLAIIRAVCDEIDVGPRAGGTGSNIRFVKRLDEEER